MYKCINKCSPATPFSDFFVLQTVRGYRGGRQPHRRSGLATLPSVEAVPFVP